MSVVHICHGQDGVGIGVRGAAAFWVWNWVHVSHCQTASSMPLFMPGLELTSISKQLCFGGSLMETGGAGGDGFQGLVV